MGRRNRPKRAPQQRRSKTGLPKIKGPPPPPLGATFVQPKGTCPSRKIRYGTADDAERAMLAQQKAKARVGSGWTAKRHYQCPRCDGHHLTSRETWGN